MSATLLFSSAANQSTGIGQTMPPYGNGGRSEAMQTEQTFKLETAQERQFERTLKTGVYHALHKQEILTDGQLAKLLERLAKGGAVG